MPLAHWSSIAPTALGGLAWGATPEGVHPEGDNLARLDMPLLAGPGPCVDAWQSGQPVASGQHGALHWVDDGRWLFGTLDLPVTDPDLTEISRQAYLNVFEVLRQTGATHLLRLWNYLPGINEDGGGLERYRQFNAGRQQAFLDAGLDPFEGAPAACALGQQGGPLALRFLAGRSAPLPLENPRQVPAYRYSSQYGPRSPSFSRAALTDAGNGQLLLLISGTASIVGEHSLHPGNITAQLEETLRNLNSILTVAHARSTAHFSLTELEWVVYLRHPEHLPVVQALLEAAVGPDAPAARSAVYLQADVCRSELLVEIEAHGFAAGTLRP
jgi:chorismate lyase/3-hydroxybenzoate synthase